MKSNSGRTSIAIMEEYGEGRGQGGLWGDMRDYIFSNNGVFGAPVDGSRGKCTQGRVVDRALVLSALGRGRRRALGES